MADNYFSHVTHNAAKMSPKQTLFVKGIDSSLGEDEVRAALQTHFGNCGVITKVGLPSDRETGTLKGIAYIDFTDKVALQKALKLDQTELNDSYLTVNEATPWEPRSDGGRSGDRSGGRFSNGGRYNSGGRGDKGQHGGSWHREENNIRRLIREANCNTRNCFTVIKQWTSKCWLT